MFAGDWEACKLQVQGIYAAIKRLRPKRVIGTECGHAHRGTVIEGPYWAGLRDGQTPVPYLHYVQWVAEALRTGKLKIDPTKRIKIPVTYQDSCNYIRNWGLSETVREIVSYMVEPGYFHEMTPNKEHNFCCGGGGGFNGIGKFRPQRNKGMTRPPEGTARVAPSRRRSPSGRRRLTSVRERPASAGPVVRASPWARCSSRSIRAAENPVSRSTVAFHWASRV